MTDLGTLAIIAGSQANQHDSGVIKMAMQEIKSLRSKLAAFTDGLPNKGVLIELAHELEKTYGHPDFTVLAQAAIVLRRIASTGDK